MLTINDRAHFSWSYHHIFFLETVKGNYLWSDPDYPGGNNTIIPTKLTYEQWLRSEHLGFARNKGIHVIKDYCGPDVVIKDTQC